MAQGNIETICNRGNTTSTVVTMLRGGEYENKHIDYNKMYSKYLKKYMNEVN